MGVKTILSTAREVTCPAEQISQSTCELSDQAVICSPEENEEVHILGENHTPQKRIHETFL